MDITFHAVPLQAPCLIESWVQSGPGVLAGYEMGNGRQGWASAANPVGQSGLPAGGGQPSQRPAAAG